MSRCLFLAQISSRHIIRPFLPIFHPVALSHPIFLDFSPTSSLTAAFPPPSPHRQFVATALPVPSRYKICSPHVNTAHFRLRRVIDHFRSLVQLYSFKLLIMMRNEAGVVAQAFRHVVGNGNELDLPETPKQRAPPKCSKCRNPGHRGRCEPFLSSLP